MRFAAVVAQVRQADRGAAVVGVVAPQAALRIEAVVAEQAPAVGGEQVDGIDEVVGDGVGEEVVEVDPHPAGFEAAAAGADGVLEAAGAVGVDVQETVAVGAGAGAAAAGLDAEQVVEDGDEVVVVQQPPGRGLDGERDDGEPVGPVSPRTSDEGDRAAAGDEGTLLRARVRRRSRTPGVPGPPMNLCGLRKTASLAVSGRPGRPFIAMST
ncbi:MAG TPA: hypothetical protein VI248_09145 [Kineosporiaceae bacterium]